jgi:hypothetical protein
MKFENLRKYCAAVIGATALSLTSVPAKALDFKGLSGPGDYACAFNPACSLARGGVSDLMIVLDVSGNVFDALVAFGSEEADNIYYFDPALVPPDPTAPLTFLAEPGGTFSDVFGDVTLQVGFPFSTLGFISDPFTGLSGQVFPGAITETPGALIPGLVMEPGSVPTIAYSATPYLAPALRAAGFSAVFFSDVDVPEPDTLSLLGIGILGLLGHARRRQSRIIAE